MLDKPKILNYFFSRKYLFLTIVLSALFICYYYSSILLHPGEFVFNDQGDAIKNYFCFIWHVDADEGYTNFSGTNYPFGELQYYTDGNPLLSDLIRLFSFLKPYSIAIYNLSLIASMLICSILLFKTLRNYNVYEPFAALASVGITILCPQVFRLPGHFTLAYSFIIPLIIYLLSHNENENLKNRGVMAICLFLIFLIHPYFGMMCSFFTLLFTVFQFAISRVRVTKVFTFNILLSILPITAYFLLVKISDHHPDRSTNPYGFLYFKSNIESVFISTHPPFRHLLSQIYKIKIQNWEGVAYVGITSLIAIFALPVIWIKRKKELQNLIRTNTRVVTLLAMMASSICLLLFSMGVPFIWNLEWLLDYFPLIKQFRAPGRFAWIFFFCMTLFSTIIISRFFLAKSHLYLRTITCSILLLMFSVEGIPFHNALKGSLVKNPFNSKSLDKEIKLLTAVSDLEKYQAIIPLPYFHNGSDVYNFPGTNKILRASFVLSYHTKIPLLANYTPRCSVSESVKMIQVLGNEIIEKPIINDLPNKKPFLILYSKEGLQPEGTDLLSRAHKLRETQNYILFEISVPELFVNTRKDKLDYFLTNQPQLYNKEHHYSKDSSFIFSNFDNLKGGVYSGHMNENNLIYTFQENRFEKTATYELSFWYDYMDGKADLNNVLSISELKNFDTIILAQRNLNAMPNIQGNMTVAKLDFSVENPNNKLIINLSEKSNASEKQFKIDNLLVRRKNTDVYTVIRTSAKDSLILLNNIILN